MQWPRNPHKLVPKKKVKKEKKSLFIKKGTCVMTILNPELLMRFSPPKRNFSISIISHFETAAVWWHNNIARVKALNCTEKGEMWREMATKRVHVMKWKVGRVLWGKSFYGSFEIHQQLLTMFFVAGEASRMVCVYAIFNLKLNLNYFWQWWHLNEDICVVCSLENSDWDVFWVNMIFCCILLFKVLEKFEKIFSGEHLCVT